MTNTMTTNTIPMALAELLGNPNTGGLLALIDNVARRSHNELNVYEHADADTLPRSVASMREDVRYWDALVCAADVLSALARSHPSVNGGPAEERRAMREFSTLREQLELGGWGRA